MDENISNQVANILSQLGAEEVRKIASAPYGHAERKMAMGLGLSDALAERGMTVSDFNLMLASGTGGQSNIKTAAFEPGKLLTMSTLALVLASAYGGSLTGKAHRSIERRINKEDDQENVRLREKAHKLGDQRDELQEDLNSRPAKTMSPGIARKSAPRSDVMSLID